MFVVKFWEKQEMSLNYRYRMLLEQIFPRMKLSYLSTNPYFQKKKNLFVIKDYKSNLHKHYRNLFVIKKYPREVL